MLAREKAALGGVVYGRNSWRQHSKAILEGVEVLLKCSDRAQLNVVVDSARGSCPQHGPYNAPALQDALLKADSVAVSIQGPDLRIGIELGDDRSYATPRAPPPALFFALRWPDTRSGTNTAVQAFLRLAERSQPLHGGVDVYGCLDAAISDVSLIAEGLHQLSPAQRLRWQYDSTHVHELATRARRLYPITLLGDALQAPNDAKAARAAGATRVKELQGCMIVEALCTLDEAMDPAWRGQKAELLRWLWPRTLQSPSDQSPAAPSRGRPARLRAPSDHNHTSAL